MCNKISLTLVDSVGSHYNAPFLVFNKQHSLLKVIVWLVIFIVSAVIAADMDLYYRGRYLPEILVSGATERVKGALLSKHLFVSPSMYCSC